MHSCDKLTQLVDFATCQDLRAAAIAPLSLDCVMVLVVFVPKADIRQRIEHVCLVPKGDIAATSGARLYDRRPWHQECQRRCSVQFYRALVFAA